MPTLPVLQNTSNNFSVSSTRHSISSVDGGGDKQPGSASFGEMLAHEMNAKRDVAEASSTTPNETSEEPGATAGDSKDLEDLKVLKDVKGLDELEDSRNVKGSKTYGTQAEEEQQIRADTGSIAILAAPQIKDLKGGGELPSLKASQQVPVPTETPAGTSNGNPTEIQTAIPTEPRTSGGAKLPTDAGMGVRDGAQVDARAVATQAEPATPGTDASAAIAPAGDQGPRTPGMLAAVTAAAAAMPARAKPAAVTQDIQGIQDAAAIKLEFSGRQRAAQETEFNLPAFGAAGRTEKFEKSLPELAFRDMHASLPNTPIGLAIAAATEHSAVPAAPGTAGMPAHTALWLEPRIGAAGWDNALGQKVLWMVSNQQQVAALNLDPPDLGPMQVILSITDDQASATFVSQHAEVRQAIEAAMPRLKEMMAESGISLGNTTVSADTSRQQDGHERRHRPDTHQHRNGDSMDISNAKSINTGIGTSYMGAGKSRLVDTFA